MFIFTWVFLGISSRVRSRGVSSSVPLSSATDSRKCFCLSCFDSGEIDVGRVWLPCPALSRWGDRSEHVIGERCVGGSLERRDEPRMDCQRRRISRVVHGVAWQIVAFVGKTVELYAGNRYSLPKDSLRQQRNGKRTFIADLVTKRCSVLKKSTGDSGTGTSISNISLIGIKLFLHRAGAVVDRGSVGFP